MPYVNLIIAKSTRLPRRSMRSRDFPRREIIAAKQPCLRIQELPMTDPFNRIAARPVDKSADNLCVECALPFDLHTVFFMPRQDCRCPRAGLCSTLITVRGSVGTRFSAACLGWPGCQPASSWKRGKLPKADGSTGGSGLHRSGSAGVGAKNLRLRLTRDGRGNKAPKFESRAPFARPV